MPVMWEYYSATGADTPIQRRVHFSAVVRASGSLDELAEVRDGAGVTFRALGPSVC